MELQILTNVNTKKYMPYQCLKSYIWLIVIRIISKNCLLSHNCTSLATSVKVTYKHTCLIWVGKLTIIRNVLMTSHKGGAALN